VPGLNESKADGSDNLERIHLKKLFVYFYNHLALLVIKIEGRVGTKVVVHIPQTKPIFNNILIIYQSIIINISLQIK
jgi:hypothetical protein